MQRNLLSKEDICPFALYGSYLDAELNNLDTEEKREIERENIKKKKYCLGIWYFMFRQNYLGVFRCDNGIVVVF